MYRHPALVLVSFLIAGLVIGRFFVLHPLVIFSALAILIIFYIWAIYIQPASRARTSRLTPSARGDLLFLGVFFIGILMQCQIVEEEQTAQKLVASIEQYGNVEVVGSVTGLPRYREHSIFVSLANVKVTRKEKVWHLPGKLQVVICGKAKKQFPEGSFTRGDIVRVFGKVQRPVSLRNPLLFNYAAYLRQKGIYATTLVYVPQLLSIRAPPGGRTLVNQVLLLIGKIRGYAYQQFFSRMKPENATVAYSVLFGKSHSINPQERQRFIDAGLIHLFAVSGLHTGLLTLVLFLFFITITSNLRLTIIFTVCGLAFYCALVGFRTPVVRAAFMADVYLLSLLILRRPVRGIDVLATSAFIVLLCNPRALFQADFQLSYLSVFGILLLKPVLENLFYLHPTPHTKHRQLAHYINKFAIDPIQVVFAVQIFLLPLLVYYYHRFSLIGFISNIFAVPLTLFIILFGGLYVLSTAILPIVSPLLVFLTSVSTETLRFFTSLSALLPFSAVSSPPLPWWAIGVYYMLLLGGSYVQGLRTPIARLRGKAQLLIVVTAICALLVWIPIVQHQHQSMTVYFLDVGQGDSAFLQFPNDNTMLIDGGRNFPRDMGQMVIAPFLNALGVEQLDVVVATHPDADHIGGLPYILQNFFVGRLIEGGSVSDTKTFKRLQKTIHQTGTPVYIVTRNDEIKGFEPARVMVLNPSPDILGRYGNNNDSVVLRIAYQKATFLFTGDAEKTAEDSMLSSGVELRAVVLKAGHHGSRYSSSPEFLDAVHPDVVIFSCGRNNRYGHPHPEVIERLKQRGIRYYRTDEQGCITITTDGRYLRIQTEK
ncbi:DNA internalization-related competence protein ComEC/Rec2 [Candidatus Sumerlaeota bacterium]|nr:DNA internalization-related competence protein ComEC/Rec2 [Candidatus Sumerlaeota bacterium]